MRKEQQSTLPCTSGKHSFTSRKVFGSWGCFENQVASVCRRESQALHLHERSPKSSIGPHTVDAFKKRFISTHVCMHVRVLLSKRREELRERAEKFYVASCCKEAVGGKRWKCSGDNPQLLP